MSKLTEYIDSRANSSSIFNFDIEDDVFQEADEEKLPLNNTGGPDSLVEDVTGDSDEQIEPAKPMESLPPIHDDRNGNVPSEEISNDVIMPEEKEEREKPPADAPISDEDYEKIEDDGDSFDPSIFDNIKNTQDNMDIPDTTPDPDDKDQGNFEGPMKYVPLYQRRNEDDLTGFGSDYKGDTPNNQYDINEVNRINVLIASEAAAMDEYAKAGKESKDHTMQRLYADISSEERFHLEQLLYAKSQITGEIYIPRDPDIKNEYKELLALGMDEETAMTTAVDKVGLMPREVSDEDMKEAAEDIITMKEYFMGVIREANIVLEHMTDGKLDKDVSETIQETYNTFMGIDNDVIMEAVGNIEDGIPFNPFKFLADVVGKMYKAILGFIRKLKGYISKMIAWNKKTMNWIKANGIKGLFAEGLHLYFYDAQNASVDLAGIATYIDTCMEIAHRAGDICGIVFNRIDIGKYFETNFRHQEFRTIEDGMAQLRKLLVTKSKLIVNDQNEEAIEALFFGISKEKYVQRSGLKITEAKSKNIYYQYERALTGAEAALETMKAFLDLMSGLQSNTQSVFYTHRTDRYDPCYKAINLTVKQLQKLVNYVTSDINECTKINNRLIEATNIADEKYARTGGIVNKYAKDSATGKSVSNYDSVTALKTPESKYTIKNSELGLMSNFK